MTDETRDIATRAEWKADQALGAFVSLDGKLDRLREENTSQHAEGQKTVRDGFEKVHGRINKLVYAAFGTSISVIAYLVHLLIGK